MLITKDTLPAQHLASFKGGKGELLAHITADGDNKILFGSLAPGHTVGEHRHKTSSEIIFITAGQGVALCDGQKEILTPGVVHYCPKGSAHTILNDSEENLEFFAVVPEHNK